MLNCYSTLTPIILTLNGPSLQLYLNDSTLDERLKTVKFLNLSCGQLGSPHLKKSRSSDELASDILLLCDKMPCLEAIELRKNPFFAPEALLSIHDNIKNGITIQSDYTDWLESLNPKHLDNELAKIHYFFLNWKMTENPNIMFEKASHYIAENKKYSTFIKSVLFNALALSNKSGQLALQVSVEIKDATLLHLIYGIVRSNKTFTEHLVYLAHNTTVTEDPAEYVPRLKSSLSTRDDVTDELLDVMQKDLHRNIVKAKFKRSN